MSHDAPASPSARQDQGDRPVGPLALLALGVNGVVGVGIFFAPADLARLAPGYGSVLIFAVTALALSPVAFAFAALGRRFHEDGGPVVYARAAFGDLPSFLVGWITYVSAIASTSAVMSGLAGALRPGAGDLERRLLTAGLVTTLALVVATGIVISARVWSTLTVLKLLPLMALAIAFALAGPATPTAIAPELATATTRSWLAAGLLAMFALQGFEIVPVIAGQVRGPARSVPLATLGSLFLPALLYLVLQAACVHALPGLAASQAPLAEAAAVLGGPWLGRLVSVGTSVSALGICTGMLVTTPRYLSALAQGERLGFGLEAMNARGVPARSLLVTWLLVSLLVQSGSRGELFALSSVAVLMQFGVTAGALAVLARRRERGLTPSHAWLAPPSLAVALVLTAGASLREAVVAAIALVLGLGLRSSGRRGVRGGRERQ